MVFPMFPKDVPFHQHIFCQRPPRVNREGKIHHLIDKRGYTPYTSAHIKRVLAITEGANLRSLIYLMPRVRRFEGIEGVSERGKNFMRERDGCLSARMA
jgi:hypothetical protein